MTDQSSEHSETPQRLIEVASRLFAETSVDAVSIRSITREAQLGPAAVHYHFKTKDALVEAIIDRHGRRVIAEILAREKLLDASGNRPTTRQIVECIAVPYFDLLDRAPKQGAEWLRIVGELSRAQDERLTRGAREVTDLLQTLVERRYPLVSADRRIASTAVAINSLLTLAGQIQALADLASRPVKPDMRKLLIDFVSGGLDGSLQAVAIGPLA